MRGLHQLVNGLVTIAQSKLKLAQVSLAAFHLHQSYHGKQQIFHLMEEVVKVVAATTAWKQEGRAL
jgi:hypothetical protein